VSPSALTLEAPEPKPELPTLHLSSRIAITVDVAGQPITIVPARPAGGVEVHFEVKF
jgi:hypothetical protein